MREKISELSQSLNGPKKEISLTLCFSMRNTEILVIKYYLLIIFLDTLILSHLPDGPTATFRVSGLKLR